MFFKLLVGLKKHLEAKLLTAKVFCVKRKDFAVEPQNFLPLKYIANLSFYVLYIAFNLT